MRGQHLWGHGVLVYLGTQGDMCQGQGFWCTQGHMWTPFEDLGVGAPEDMKGPFRDMGDEGTPWLPQIG